MGAGGSCCKGAVDDERMVTKMDLSHCGCTEVPPIVFQAERYVETLNLAHNRILSLPPQLFHCQELKHLNLLDNGLDSLPPAVGSLQHLISLKLDKNCIKDLPDNLKSCRKLKRLSLSNNQLQQLPAVLTQLINLEELYLNDCDLTFLPASVGRISKLRVLELRNNRICNLPLSMNRMTVLTRLDLGDNSLESLPDCTSSLTSLQELLLDNNDLETFSGAGLKKLEHLDVSYNNLRGIGKDLGQCSSLTLLNLGWNYLESLPESVANLVHLEGLVLEMNEISTLPRALGKMVHLEELNLSNNRLCDLPSSLGLLRSLTVLNFSRNYVQELPCEIGSCQRLSIVNASYNRLQSLPAEVGYLNNLKVLDLVGNFLMHLPISMSNLTGVRAIWLSANQNVPLIPFTEEVNMASGERFLTNIALPQLGESALPPVENVEPVEKSSWRRKIRFEEDEDVLPGRLDRTPTPFPKELRCPTRKAQRNEDNYVNVVDGRVAVFQQAQTQQNGSSAVTLTDSNVTVIREANIRRNKDTKTDMDNGVVEEMQQEGPIYNGSRRSSVNESQVTNEANEVEVSENDKNGPAGNSNYEPVRERTEAEHDLTYGRMSPILEEGSRPVETPLTNGIVNGGPPSTWPNHVNNIYGRAGHDEGDAVSINSLESERRRSYADSTDYRTNGMTDTNINQVVYSNMRNGNPYPPHASYHRSGYYTPPHIPVQRNDGVDNYVPYRNNSYTEANTSIPNQTRVAANGIRPNSINRQSPYGSGRQSPYGTINQPSQQASTFGPPIQNPYGTVQQSPYGTIKQSTYGTLRQSPRPLENGNIIQELERPPSKQEMLSIAERNISQNIPPPCYEIAKMYSTKAALFEHCHKPNNN